MRLTGCLLALASWLFCAASQAACTDLVLGQHTWHSHDGYEEDGMDYEYNNNNYLVGCVTEDEHLVAVFENSYEKTTVLVAHTWKDNSYSPYVSPYLVLGVASGYKDHLAHVGPLSPYGFVGLDIHPVNNKYGLMISTAFTVTSVGVRFALK